MNKNTFDISGIEIYLDAQLFEKEAIFKTLYWYGDKFITLVNLIEPNEFQIRLEPIKKFTLDEIKESYLKLNQDLLDFQLRQIIHSETKNVRDLIIAKAFANGSLDELPSGDISDPVGFMIK